MWTEKHRPKTHAEIVGNSSAREQFVQWLRKWKTGGKAALLYGPPGVGKSTLVLVAASELSYRVVEMNASDVRTDSAIRKVVGPASSSSLTPFVYGGRGTLIFLDEVDGILGSEDRGGVTAILDFIKKSTHPIALVANDPWDPKLRSLRDSCIMIRFRGADAPELEQLLRKIMQRENAALDEATLSTIVESSGGDVRAAINDLQAYAEHGAATAEEMQVWRRDRQTDVFETLDQLFSAKSPEEARRAMDQSPIDFELLFNTIHDNLPVVFRDPSFLATAYDAVSRADVELGRIRKTGDWKFLGYAMEQVARILASSNKGIEVRRRFIFPPSKIMMLSGTRADRALRDEVLELVGKSLHISARTARTEALPYVRIMMENPRMRGRISEWLDLDEKMTEYITGEG